MSRSLVLVVGIIGLLLFIPGALFISTILNGLRSGDSVVARAPLSRVRLDQLEPMHSVVMHVVIPDTAVWTRIRRVWGDPTFVVLAVEPARSTAYCLPSLGTRIEVTERGSPIPLGPGSAPYGYSDQCALSSFRFRAAAGAKLALKITNSGEGPLPSGEVIVVGAWSNTKDKLVGELIQKDLTPIAILAVIFGALLTGAAAILMRRHSIRGSGMR